MSPEPAAIDAPPAFRIHDRAQALAAAEAAAAAGRPVLLVTPDSALFAQGPLYWAELQATLRARGLAPWARLLVDADEAPGLALAALRSGLTLLLFRGAAPVAAKLQAILQAAGGTLWRSAPAAVDLWGEPDPASAVAARLRLGPAEDKEGAGAQRR